MPAPQIDSVTLNQGPTTGGPPEVIIAGAHFSGLLSVMFGGVQAQVTSSGNTQIKVIPPGQAPQTVKVKVATGQGTNAPNAPNDEYTYLAITPTVTSINPASGATTGGTQVTIIGTNFVGVTQVAFGATPALSFSVVSPTQINATSPSGSGTVNVRVTNGSGISADAAANQFAYFPVVPTVSSVVPANGAVGSAITVNGTNFFGVTTVAFGAVPATGFSVTSPTQIQNVIVPFQLPAGVTVHVRVTNASGTSAESASDQFTYA